MHSRAHELFNEGVHQSLMAIELLATGASEQAENWEAEALQKYNAALVIDPVHPAILSAKAFTLAQQKKIAEAAECFEAAIELDPSSSENHYQLGLCFFDLGMPEDGITAFNDAFTAEKGNSLRERACRDLTTFGQRVFGYSAHCYQLKDDTAGGMLIMNAVSALAFACECDPKSQASKDALLLAQKFLLSMSEVPLPTTSRSRE